MKAEQPIPSQPNSFEQHLKAAWLAQPMEERVVTAEFFDTESELDRDTAVWNDAPERNATVVQPPERFIRLRAAVRALGRLPIEAIGAVTEKLPRSKVIVALGHLTVATLLTVSLGQTLSTLDDSDSEKNPLVQLSNLRQPTHLPSLGAQPISPTTSLLEAAPPTTEPTVETSTTTTTSTTLPTPTTTTMTVSPSRFVADTTVKPAAVVPRNQSAFDIPPHCEQYRPLVAKYNWPVDAALFTASKESDCDESIVSPTDDWGLFQLNGIPVLDPEENIRIAYGKYVDGRVGQNNFSAWYAVCTEGDDPQPKYTGIHCQ